MSSKKSHLTKSLYQFIANYISESNQDPNEPRQSTSIELNIESSQETSSTSQLQYASQIDSNDEKEINLNTKRIELNDKIDEPECLFQADFGDKNFLKGCKWSPDGTCVLTNSDDFTLRIFDVTRDMINNQLGQENPNPIDLKASLKMSESGGIYDYAWYPLMNSNDAASSCLFATSKSNPIHLFDAYTGQIRCSYRGHNHLDELDTAYSLAFNVGITHLYAGYKKHMRIFDISRPGKNYQELKLTNNDFNLPGIISCISFSGNGSYAVGSYSKYIGLFIEENNGVICLLQGHAGGITHLAHSRDGKYLFSGARKDSEIYCWDLRNLGQVLKVFKRDVDTNQRFYFELNQEYLCSGDKHGNVNMWRLDDMVKTNEHEENSESNQPFYSFRAHDDCVNGVSLHPHSNLISTASGQRKFYFNKNLNNSSSEEDEDGLAQTPPAQENKLKIWNMNLKKFQKM